MKKIIIQVIIILASFFATWYLFTQINWMSLFKVEQLTKSTEEKLGDLFWDWFNKAEKEIQNPDITDAVDSLITRISDSNKIDEKLIKLHIVQNDDVNAFALPNGHLVIYTGLISASENESELCGVICHELAHISMDHVMKKLVKEVGLSVLISMTTGNGGSDIIKETAKILSSTAYDRNLEESADYRAVDYLIAANINPEGFANFLYRLAETESSLEGHLSWISTHPGTKQRAENILEYAGDKELTIHPVLDKITWDKMKDNL
jgi:predicted Zn-dependent protease